jgi:hypothetical protein
MDRSYKLFVMFKNGARYLADPEHHGVAPRGDLDGDQDLLQEELDLMRRHSAMSLERFRAIEDEMKRGAFALVDEEEALSKAKRNSSVSLISSVQRKQAAHKSSMHSR